MKKAEVKETEAKVTPQKEEPRYRYYCEGCTQIAVVSSNEMVGVPITCQFCQKVQVTKPENWLPL